MAGIRYKGQIFSGVASVGDADDVAYGNTQSGLTATNVQDALDEINSNILGDLATVETANVASKSYAVGDLLVLGNHLYKVTAAITSGADLVEGTNIQETTLADAVWKRGGPLTNFANGRTIRTGYDLTNNRLLIDIIFGDGDIHRLGITTDNIKYEYYRGSTGIWTTNGTWNKSS